MIDHGALGKSSFARSRKLALMIRNGALGFGGNKKLKIYGRLDCRSGKRMKVSNRVFFKSELEAIDAGYRPCGNCMRRRLHPTSMTLNHNIKH
jgi:methylphosphotriester-DNA--protein-cysteine methyltransferase